MKVIFSPAPAFLILVYYIFVNNGEDWVKGWFWEMVMNAWVTTFSPAPAYLDVNFYYIFSVNNVRLDLKGWLGNGNECMGYNFSPAPAYLDI